MQQELKVPKAQEALRVLLAHKELKEPKALRVLLAHKELRVLQVLQVLQALLVHRVL